MSETTAIEKKPGYKTSEFWMATAAMLIGTLFASGVVTDGGALDKILGLAVSILGALGYTVSRTLVKKAG